MLNNHAFFQLVGNGVRTVLTRYPELLEGLRVAIVAAHTNKVVGEAEAADFVERHSRVLKPLAVIGRHTRRTTDLQLSDDQKKELKDACAEFGVAWRLSYKDRLLTPKGHVVEVHVPQFVDRYGVRGVFGEDGTEALHVACSACRRIVRVMRNPEARHKAQSLHLARWMATPKLNRVPLKRRKVGATAAAL